jgi:hypothetical protein
VADEHAHVGSGADHRIVAHRAATRSASIRSARQRFTHPWKLKPWLFFCPVGSDPHDRRAQLQAALLGL